MKPLLDAAIQVKSVLRYDLKASITVFFVALPLCLGISLASGVSVFSGLMAGVIGGILIPMISNSSMSVSGPAAGLTAISAAAILRLGDIQLFFLAVSIAGVLQIVLGIFRLGGFTHLIPSSVIKGMLAAIGIILISKQIPILIGYDKPDFWRDKFFNILTLNHGFDQITDLYESIALGPILVAAISLLFLMLWKKLFAYKVPFLPASFLTVLVGSFTALLFSLFIPSLQLNPSQFVTIPDNLLGQFSFPDFSTLLHNKAVWEVAVLICFVATLETLLSVEAIDKMDRDNRITLKNRELVAQGIGNFFSGLAGGLPITAVIVRGSANIEAGARSKSSAFLHGIWLLLAILFAASILNHIPYAVLAIILVRTGYNLAKPEMMLAIYRQGREQFFPFIVTVVSILFTDLLIGVVIGIIYAIYFLVKHTYRAGYKMQYREIDNVDHYEIVLALNVSFLNKRRIKEILDDIPEHSIVRIDGTKSNYIDHDILEIFSAFRETAMSKHIQLEMVGIREVETLAFH